MENKMKLSVQAMGAMMICLQKCLMNETDIMELLGDLELVDSTEGLVVLNPPVLEFPAETSEEPEVVLGGE